MSDALIAFAKTGNPNTAAIKWPRFDSKNPMRLDFGERIEPASIHPAVFFYLKNPDVKMDFPKGGRAGARGGQGPPGAPNGPQLPGR